MILATRPQPFQANPFRMGLIVLPALMLRALSLRRRGADLKHRRGVPGRGLDRGDGRISPYRDHVGLVPLEGSPPFLFPTKLLAKPARP